MPATTATKTVFEDAPQGATCDRCGIGTAAQIRVVFPDGLDLTFCNNHARRYTDKLLLLVAAEEGS